VGFAAPAAERRGHRSVNDSAAHAQFYYGTADVRPGQSDGVGHRFKRGLGVASTLRKLRRDKSLDLIGVGRSLNLGGRPRGFGEVIEGESDSLDQIRGRFGGA
jgi:hypothetical protein